MQVSVLVKEIKDGLKQASSSSKDEVRVMRAMLNDRDYEVGVYGQEGKIGTYNPSADARSMIASVIASAAKVSKDEAQVLAEDHEFSNGEAASMVNVSKEFVNTYLGTGRKLNFGGRESSTLALLSRDIPQSVSRYPKKVGENTDGTGIYENAEKTVPAHINIKAISPCPVWVKINA